MSANPGDRGDCATRRQDSADSDWFKTLERVVSTNTRYTRAANGTSSPGFASPSRADVRRGIKELANKAYVSITCLPQPLARALTARTPRSRVPGELPSTESRDRTVSLDLDMLTLRAPADPALEISRHGRGGEGDVTPVFSGRRDRKSKKEKDKTKEAGGDAHVQELSWQPQDESSRQVAGGALDKAPGTTAAGASAAAEDAAEDSADTWSVNVEFSPSPEPTTNGNRANREQEVARTGGNTGLSGAPPTGGSGQGGDRRSRGAPKSPLGRSRSSTDGTMQHKKTKEQRATGAAAMPRAMSATATATVGKGDLHHTEMPRDRMDNRRSASPFDRNIDEGPLRRSRSSKQHAVRPAASAEFPVVEMVVTGEAPLTRSKTTMEGSRGNSHNRRGTKADSPARMPSKTTSPLRSPGILRHSRSALARSPLGRALSTSRTSRAQHECAAERVPDNDKGALGRVHSATEVCSANTCGDVVGNVNSVLKGGTLTPTNRSPLRKPWGEASLFGTPGRPMSPMSPAPGTLSSLAKGGRADQSEAPPQVEGPVEAAGKVPGKVARSKSSKIRSSHRRTQSIGTISSSVVAEPSESSPLGDSTSGPPQGVEGGKSGGRGKGHRRTQTTTGLRVQEREAPEKSPNSKSTLPPKSPDVIRGSRTPKAKSSLTSQLSLVERGSPREKGKLRAQKSFKEKGQNSPGEAEMIISAPVQDLYPGKEQAPMSTVDEKVPASSPSVDTSRAPTSIPETPSKGIVSLGPSRDISPFAPSPETQSSRRLAQLGLSVKTPEKAMVMVKGGTSEIQWANERARILLHLDSMAQHHKRLFCLDEDEQAALDWRAAVNSLSIGASKRESLRLGVKTESGELREMTLHLFNLAHGTPGAELLGAIEPLSQSPHPSPTSTPYPPAPVSPHAADRHSSTAPLSPLKRTIAQGIMKSAEFLRAPDLFGIPKSPGPLNVLSLQGALASPDLLLQNGNHRGEGIAVYPRSHSASNDGAYPATSPGSRRPKERAVSPLPGSSGAPSVGGLLQGGNAAKPPRSRDKSVSIDWSNKSGTPTFGLGQAKGARSRDKGTSIDWSNH